LLDVWPARRLAPLAAEGGWPVRRLVWEKLPLFALCALSSVVTALAQHVDGVMGSVDDLGVGTRLANALLAWVAYPSAAVWPSGLAPFYPHPATVYPDALSRMLPAALLAGALLVAITTLVLGRLRDRPYLAVGWLWYLGMAVPVIGLVQVGSQSHADRYAYLPLIGLQIALAFGLRDLWRARPGLRTPIVAGAVAAVMASTALAWRQTGFWRDDATLFGHTLAVTTDNYFAHYNLGNHLLRSGRPERAEAHFRETLRIQPRHPEAAANLGVALAQQGRAEEARLVLARALDIDPQAAAPHVTLGLLDAQERRYDRAEQHLLRAIELDPANADAYNDLGAVLLAGGRFREAAEALERAVALSPRLAGAHANLGYARLRLHDAGRAEAALRRALEIEPGMALARRHLEALARGAPTQPASRIP
jgi:Tfp pilus assembly protein PilF